MCSLTYKELDLILEMIGIAETGGVDHAQARRGRSRALGHPASAATGPALMVSAAEDKIHRITLSNGHGLAVESQQVVPIEG